MKSIAVGAKWDMGVKWHPQISDKSELCQIEHIYTGCIRQWDTIYTAGASTKRHAYWAMANCGGSGQRLRELLINIVEHYKVFSISN